MSKHSETIIVKAMVAGMRACINISVRKHTKHSYNIHKGAIEELKCAREQANLTGPVTPHSQSCTRNACTMKQGQFILVLLGDIRTFHN